MQDNTTVRPHVDPTLAIRIVFQADPITLIMMMALAVFLVMTKIFFAKSLSLNLQIR